MKYCNKCQQTKESTEFHRRSDTLKVILRSSCKQCLNKQNNDNNKKKRNRRKPKLSAEERKIRQAISVKKHRSTLAYKIKHAASQAKRRAALLQATPKWLTDYQKAAIEANYELAATLTALWGIKMTVDHIVPLKGKNVCGLHVPWNLQVMESTENSSKNNKFEV